MVLKLWIQEERITLQRAVTFILETVKMMYIEVELTLRQKMQENLSISILMMWLFMAFMGREQTLVNLQAVLP